MGLHLADCIEFIGVLISLCRIASSLCSCFIIIFLTPYIFFMKTIKAILFVALFAVPFLLPTQTQARGGHKSHSHGNGNGNGNGSGGNGGGKSGNSAPIDGGLSILLAAGVGLGAKKIYDKNKKKHSNSDAV
jgi:uncharacterized membrane protein YgcG